MIRGPWLHTILFEVPVLAIVNEVYFRALQKADDFDEGRRRLRDKIALLNDDPRARWRADRRLRHAPPILAPLA